MKHQLNNLLLWFVSAQLLSWCTFCGHPKVRPLKVGRFPVFISLKKKGILNYDFGYYDNLVTIAMRYVADAYCPKEALPQI